MFVELAPAFLIHVPLILNLRESGAVTSEAGGQIPEFWFA